MKYRLLAVDMDGTLLNSRSEISEETEKTVRTAVKNGMLFVVSSGRSVQGVCRYKLVRELDMPVITYNGAVIMNPVTGKVLYEQGMEQEDSYRILMLGKKLGTTMCVWSNGRLYGNIINDNMIDYKKLSGVEPELIQDYDALAEQGITKILWYDDIEKIRQYQSQIDSMHFNSLSYCTSNPMFLEFFNNKVSKAAAMERIGEIYHIDREEMIAAGDGRNDLSMIKYAGLGIAMANADDAVKAEADELTLSNDEDGVAAVIRKYFMS